jgi:pimeloyl-ACP methyl ester carboxylesterase
MATLAFTRRGAGAPLVLLHGIGGSRHAWDPVIPALAERFDVIAIDLPGHGDSEPLPAEVEPSPAALAASVAGFLDALGVTAPHVAGNSLGGWIALELAELGPVASLTLLSPAGLWRDKAPRYCRVSLRVIRWLAKHATGALSGVGRYRLGRVLTLGQIYGRPARVDPDYARTAIRDMGTCPGFDATMRASERRQYTPGSTIDVPVTVAFGSRDFILLPRQSRHLDELPPGTRVEPLPGAGHVPMPDSSDAVAALITSATTHDRSERRSTA